MQPHTLLGAALIGLVIGFLGGLLGKGGSAIATPLLHAIGVPAIVAVAAPLPATVPSTLAATWVYWKGEYLDTGIVKTCVLWGVPATIVGASATRWIGGGFLVQLTDVVLVGIGIRLLLTAGRTTSTEELTTDSNDSLDRELDELLARESESTSDGSSGRVVLTARRTIALAEAPNPRLLAVVAIIVGFSAGLLANSGGFLLAPLMMTVVKLPIRQALAVSLAVSAVLAIPGTVVHAALGHIDWTLVGVFAMTSVPLSFLGARVALRIDAHRLERLYGAVLVGLGATLLLAQ
jgi:uncharacterized protein